MKIKSFLMALMAVCALSFAACEKDNDEPQNNPNTPENPDNPNNPDNKVVPDTRVNDLGNKAWSFQGAAELNPNALDTSASVHIAFSSDEEGILYFATAVNDIFIPQDCGLIRFEYSCSQGQGTISSYGHILASFIVATDGKLYLSASQIGITATMSPAEYIAPTHQGIDLCHSRWTLDPDAASRVAVPQLFSSIVLSFPPYDYENGTISLSLNGATVDIPFSYEQNITNPYENFNVSPAEANIDPVTAMMLRIGDLFLLRKNNNLFLGVSNIHSSVPGLEGDIEELVIPLVLNNE